MFSWKSPTLASNQGPPSIPCVISDCGQLSWVERKMLLIHWNFWLKEYYVFIIIIILNYSQLFSLLLNYSHFYSIILNYSHFYSIILNYSHFYSIILNYSHFYKNKWILSQDLNEKASMLAVIVHNSLKHPNWNVIMKENTVDTQTRGRNQSYKALGQIKQKQLLKTKKTVKIIHKAWANN